MGYMGPNIFSFSTVLAFSSANKLYDHAMYLSFNRNNSQLTVQPCRHSAWCHNTISLKPQHSVRYNMYACMDCEMH